MATEYKLSYTANKIDEKLGEIDTLNANAVKVTPQTFTEEQKAQARENIGANCKTELDTFLDNTDIDYAYDENTGVNYTIIRVYKNKIDGSKQYPFVVAPDGANEQTHSAYTTAQEYGYFLTINAGLGTGSPHLPDGVIVENSKVIVNTPAVYHAGALPLTIDANGNLGYAETNIDGNTLVENGIVSACCGFCPIIIDYKAVKEFPNVNNVSHFAQNAQRQIIGQFANEDYAIITCEGRNYANSDGWTLAEAQEICKKHGLKFAYNLDGGGSTETVLGLKHINTIYEGSTGRVVPTFIVFNGSDGDSEEISVLTSISVIYSGGNVPINTSADALTDIVVTAHYSNGTNKTVTGYAISGVIAEGSNTITVSYIGKTATFTVIGVSDGEEDAEYTFVEYISMDSQQYINTGISETELYNIEYKAYNSIRTPASGGHILSSTNSYAPFLRYGDDGQLVVTKAKGNESVSPYDYDDSKPHTVIQEFDGTHIKAYVDGEEVAWFEAGNTASASNKYYLFAYGGNTSATKYRFNGRFYYLKLTDVNGELTHHYRAAMRNSDGVYGVLDVVTNTFYESNSGTAFTGA